MLFSFLKYVSPVWYLNLRPETLSAPYFVDYMKLNEKEVNLLDIDNSYQTPEGRVADASYQAFYKGIIHTDIEKSIPELRTLTHTLRNREISIGIGRNIIIRNEFFVTNIFDNYRFIRRHFNPSFSLYILFIRLLSLNNPIIELGAFFRALKVKRLSLHCNTSEELINDSYNKFDSRLLKLQPRISVIIPTLNRYDYLKNILADLERQDYRNFEVIICDQSDFYNEDFYKGWALDIRLIRQEEKALWLARNSSIKLASGEYIAFSEDDVRIQPDWLSQHLKCLDFFQADISAGVFFPFHSEIPESRRYFRWADQFATGNSMVRRDIFSTTGLFDRQFEKQRNGDGEFGLRCFLLGLKSVSNPRAFCKDIKAPTGGLREVSSWDSFRPRKVFSPRPIPSLLYFARKYFGRENSTYLLFITIPGSIIPYKYKQNKCLKIFAAFSMLILWPIILTQVIISWNRSGKKLREGAKIESI